MNEDDLRVLLTRHEELAPPSGPVAAAIDAGYRRRRRWRRAWRAGGVSLAAVALVAGSAVALNWRPAGDGGPAASAVEPSTGPGMVGRGLAGPSAAPVTGKPRNVLVVWADDGTGSPQPQVIVMHVSATGKQAYLVPLGDQVKVADLAAAYRSGGISAAGQEAAKALGGSGKPKFDAAVAVTYSGLAKAITATGGFSWCANGPCQHFTGPGTIEFLRHRSPDEALSMVLEVLDQFASITDPHLFDRVLTAGSGGVVIDTGGNKLADLLTRMGGLGELDELKEPASTVEAQTRLAELFAADSDAYLSFQANGGGN